MRALGAPCASTVASVIAVGSASCAVIASWSQDWNWRSGSGSTSFSESEARWYSRRRSAMFKAALSLYRHACGYAARVGSEKCTCRETARRSSCGHGNRHYRRFHCARRSRLSSRQSETSPKGRSKRRAEYQPLEDPTRGLHRIDDGPARDVTVIRFPAHAVVVEPENRSRRARALQKIDIDVERIGFETPAGEILHCGAFESECRIEVRIDAQPRRAEEPADCGHPGSRR